MTQELISMEQHLRRISFFSTLPDATLNAIQKQMQIKHYPKGVSVVKEGDPADAMYLIESGQVQVVSESEGEERILAYLGPGSFFGEMALLLGEQRSATVQVVIDADLWMLSKSDLDKLLSEHPSLGLTISRELSRRLQQTIRQPTKRKEIRILAVSGDFGYELARSLAQQTGEKVSWIPMTNTLPDLPSNLENVAPFATPQLFTVENLPEVLSQVMEDYPLVCLAINETDTPLTRKAIDLAEAVIQVGDVPVNWARDAALDRYWTTSLDRATLDRMARQITGRQIGLALSSGNARGIAHIGVLRVFEEEGIPIDVLSGTSAGSLFGALYAAGKSVDEITAFAYDLPKITSFRFGLWDFSLPPRSSIIQGKKTLKFIREMIDDKTFEELEIPFYVVAADYHCGEEIVIHDGPVADAVRASISIIGLFQPMHLQGRHFIDGGTVNPVPASALCDHGVEIVIASSVIPNLDERLERQDLRRKGKLPNIIGILMGAMEIMESEIIQSRMGPVDVLIKPKVADLHTMQYEKASEFIRRGEEAARKHIAEIKKLIAPRPRT